MNLNALIPLAMAAALTSAAAATETNANTADVIAAFQTQAEGIAGLTDAECLAAMAHLQRSKAATLLAAADSIEQEENLTEVDCAKLVASQPMDGMPDDLRNYLTESSALFVSTQQQLDAICQQLDELRRSEEEDAEEQAKPLIRQFRALRKQYNTEEQALRAKYPRAVFLSMYLGSRAVQEALGDLQNEEGKAQAFLAEHPELKKGKRATVMAYLRHLAREPQPSMTAETARDTICKLDIKSRLAFADDGAYCHRCMTAGQTSPFVFPADRRSGYVWQLAEPLPNDAPLRVEWLTVPSSEMKELQSIGVLSSWHDIPDSPNTTIAALHAVKEGKVTLNFVYLKPGESDALLRMRVVVEINED